jgi:cytochrome b
MKEGSERKIFRGHYTISQKQERTSWTHNPFGCLVFNATLNNISVISWRSVLLVEETGGPGENYYSQLLSSTCRLHGKLINKHDMSNLTSTLGHRSRQRVMRGGCRGRNYELSDR